MKEQDFRTTAELLKGEGFSTAERYDAEAFGSWLVEVQVDPRLRVVWDGKDGWLIVQRQRTDLFNGQPVWDDLWVARDPDEQRPEAAVKVVLRETNQQSRMRRRRWWPWVAAAALVLLIYGGYTYSRFQSSYKEDVDYECRVFAPNSSLVFIEADWRWLPPDWWCTYRSTDGTLSSHRLDELGG